MGQTAGSKKMKNIPYACSIQDINNWLVLKSIVGKMCGFFLFAGFVCYMCKVGKPMNEFPHSPVTDDCRHAALECLRVNRYTRLIAVFVDSASFCLLFEIKQNVSNYKELIHSESESCHVSQI